MAKRRVAVVVHPESVPLLKEAFGWFLRELNGTWYFNCDEVDAGGPLCRLTVQPIEPPSVNGKEMGPMVIGLPFTYIVGTLESSERDPVGFIGRAKK